MQAVPLEIPGCFLLKGTRFEDGRGDFFKLFHAPSLAALGLETDFVESFLTTSHQGVVRGMHFQAPPADHAKMVCCITGRVRDGLVDLRRFSPTFGCSISLMLCADEADILYVPRGVAHGFAAYEDNSRMWYMVSSVHTPTSDIGIRWDSVGIDWWADAPFATVTPVVSIRDQGFPLLSAFESPFVFEDVR